MLKRIPLHFQIIIGMLIGILWAFLAIRFEFKSFTKDWVEPFGTMFIKVLKMIAVPLVLFSIIKGVSSITDSSKLGRMGIKTLGAYLLTTILAVTIGLTLVNIIQPGKVSDDQKRISNRLQYEIWANSNNVAIQDNKSYLNDSRYSHLLSDANKQFADFVSTSSENKALKLSDKISNMKNKKKASPLSFVVDMIPSNIFIAFSDGKKMLQVIFFAIFFGVVLTLIDPKKSHPVISFVDGTNEVFLKMVDIIMKAAPFFVFALMAGKISSMANSIDELYNLLYSLGKYSITVVLGLVIMAFVIYPLILQLFVKKIKYFDFFKKIGPAQALAFSTSSSAATLPVTMECVNDNLKVPEKVSNFVLPIGATVNMDGTSLYQAVAAIFLAQFFDVDLSISQQLTIVLTATLASIGSAAVPSAGLVMLMIVLSSVGLNPAWIAIIFPVDRILDMCRTVVNVTGDATVATVIAKTEGELD